MEYKLHEKIEEFILRLRENKIEYEVTQEKILFIYDYIKENLNGEEKRVMALIDLIPGALEIIRDEGKVEGRSEGRDQGLYEGKIAGRILSIKNILCKKLKEENKEICKLLNKASMEKIEEIEDKIFEINSWDEVKEILLLNKKVI